MTHTSRQNVLHEPTVSWWLVYSYCEPILCILAQVLPTQTMYIFEQDGVQLNLTVRALTLYMHLFMLDICISLVKWTCICITCLPIRCGNECTYIRIPLPPKFSLKNFFPLWAQFNSMVDFSDGVFFPELILVEIILNYE